MSIPTGPIGLKLVQPQVKLAATQNVTQVRFGHEDATPTDPAIGPVQEVESSGRSFLGRVKDGITNAIFAAPKGLLGYGELALDALALATSIFSGGFSLLLLIPGAIPKALRFLSGFKNGNAPAETTMESVSAQQGESAQAAT